MKERQKTKSSILFIDAVSGGIARLLPEEGAAFVFPLRLRPAGVRGGESIRLTASLYEEKGRREKTDALLREMKERK